MLPRVLEPELMDTEQDALEYDAMDHMAVNAQFVTDLLEAMATWSLKRPGQSENVQDEGGETSRLNILDLGAGTAQIPIELCRRAQDARVAAVDAAESMLAVARRNVAAAGLADRIELVHDDAKQLSLAADSFTVVISNSIVHHIADPETVIADVARVVTSGGLLFHRDLARPDDESQVEALVATYAANETPYQQKLLADSLRAALTLAEMRDLVARFGFAAETVQMTSDRHWTWIATHE